MPSTTTTTNTTTTTTTTTTLRSCLMKEPGLKIALQNILKMFVILICHFTVCINLEENLD